SMPAELIRSPLSADVVRRQLELDGAEGAGNAHHQRNSPLVSAHPHGRVDRLTAVRARGERRFELPRLVTLPLYLEWLGSRDPQVEDGALARVVDRHARLKVNGERQRPHVKERAHRI